MAKQLTDHQDPIVQRVLDEEGAKREHIVVHLSGAHAYGFVSPDSDLDLKAIHIAPTSALLGLHPPAPAANRMEVIDGEEIDYTSNELGQALRSLLRGDGNMLERVHCTAPLRRSALLDELAEVARKNLSKHMYRHYRGFATSQRKAVEASPQPKAKKVLYVLRTALTGVHLLETGVCIPDLTALCDDYGFGIVHELIAIKKGAEGQALPESIAAQIGSTLDRVFARLDEAAERTKLPEQPQGLEDANAWLVDVRRRYF